MQTAGGNDELRAKENELEKEIEQAKLSLNDAGGVTPPPSPERQATIEAPFEDIFTCFLSCYASMVSSLLWLHSRFWILFYAWTRSENWLTIVLISKVSLFSMLLVVVLALGLVHCFWSVFLLIYGKKSVPWVRRAAKVEKLAFLISILVGIIAVSGAFVEGKD